MDFPPRVTLNYRGQGQKWPAFVSGRICRRSPAFGRPGRAEPRMISKGKPRSWWAPGPGQVGPRPRPDGPGPGRVGPRGFPGAAFWLVGFQWWLDILLMCVPSLVVRATGSIAQW